MDKPDNTEDWWTVAEAVRARRGTLGMTQADLAQAANLGIQTIRNIEAGRPGDRRDTTLHAIEKALTWPQGLIEQLARTKLTSVPPEVDARLKRIEEVIEGITGGLERMVDGVQEALQTPLVRDDHEADGEHDE